MRKKNLTAIAVVAIAAVVLSGGLIASNMGFKLNYLLEGTGSSASGTNFVALPYNTQVGLDGAKDLFLDLGSADVSSVQQYVASTDSFQVYAGGAADFPLVAGQGLVLKMINDKSYIIVGSHDPSATVTLSPIGQNGSLTGLNHYAHPYHAVSATAQALFLELGEGVASSVQKFNRANDSFQVYAGGAADFPLNPGDGLVINMNPGPALAFAPSHY